MPQSPDIARDLFLAALDVPQSARASWLDDACAGNVALHRQLAALLRAHDEPDSLLDQPRIDLGLGAPAVPPESAPTVTGPQTPAPAMTIGPYKLLQQIGEGGMGTVYMAEQTHPMQRKVALKLIKPGMDSRQVIARFEAERQALALMDHHAAFAISGYFGNPVPPGPASKFQVQPAPDNCDPRRAATSHAGGMLVCLGDNSVRSLGPNMSSDVWWAALTPAGNEVQGDW